jgi:hypothetical protein
VFTEFSPNQKNIVNDGCTATTGPLGGVADLELAVRRGSRPDDDILVRTPAPPSNKYNN